MCGHVMYCVQVLVCEKLELVNEYYFALVMERAFMVQTCTAISTVHVNVYIPPM